MKVRGTSRNLMIGAIASVTVIAALVVGVYVNRTPEASSDEMRTVEVDDIVSGHKIEIEPEGHVLYAGIRAPYKHQPLGEEAIELNRSLVEEKTVRLRFDENPKDDKGRWVAYVFAEDVFVNQRMVAEGLAYVRLKRDEQRFAKDLLEAQNAARRAGRGLWKTRLISDEKEYPGDRKHGAFHRPSCEDVENTRPGNEILFQSKHEAFNAGFAPCLHCNP